MNNQALDDLLKQLDSHTILLTPNNRLAAVLHEQYIFAKQKQSVPSWQKPTILSINAWLENLWHYYLASAINEAPYLLNDTQARFLWEQIIASDTTHHLLQVTETAQALQSAWKLLYQYDVDIHHSAFQLSDDYIRCQQWMLHYQKICREKNYLDKAMLPTFLAEKITAGEIILPEEILLYGFTEVIPQYKRILSTRTQVLDPEVIAVTGVLSSVEGRRGLGIARSASTGMYVPETEGSTPVTAITSGHPNQNLIALPDPDSEILAMARFAKATHTAQPEAKIGCVVTDLSQHRERVLQIFTQVFFPNQPFDIEAARFPFNISAGKSLGSYPIIAAALLITGLSGTTATREYFSSLLLSPYIGSADSEVAARAKWDAQLRQDNIHRVKLFNLTADCPQFTKHIKELMQFIDNKPRTYQEWSQHFNNMLKTIGWPGEKSLSSEEYQAAQKWLSALDDFATLDKVATPTTKQQAWQQLRQIVNAHVFQPESPSSHIQILGMLEAAAVPFDYLWVAGTNDLNWPEAPKPNPFIPKSLQRELNMPHATAERELQFCSTMMTQFRESTSQLIFSYAEKDGELNYHASSLLCDFTPTPIANIMQSPYVPPEETVFTSKRWDIISDAIAPALDAQQKIMGGSDAIKLQAACPFMAFAKYRLNARELENSTQGLNSKDRGNILHSAMQHLWNKLKSQQTLLALDEKKLDDYVNEAIAAALKENAPAHHQSTHYIQLEQQRLHKIILKWLALEKTRPPFVVSTNEKSVTFEIAGHPLTLRIDRIDTLGNGQQLILDYKSGADNKTEKKWFGARPDEPQLPLYALIDAQNTVGISFAQLAGKKVCFTGVSREELNIKGIKETDAWEQKLHDWRVAINKLAADFCAGDANVYPKHPINTCQYCAFTPLCRKHELNTAHVDEELDGDSYYAD